MQALLLCVVLFWLYHKLNRFHWSRYIPVYLLRVCSIISNVLMAWLTRILGNSRRICTQQLVEKLQHTQGSSYVHTFLAMLESWILSCLNYYWNVLYRHIIFVFATDIWTDKGRRYSSSERARTKKTARQIKLVPFPRIVSRGTKKKSEIPYFPRV